MKHAKFGAVAALIISMTSGAAFAGCGIESGSIRILSNDFPALHAVVDMAETCAGDGVEFSKNHTADHEKIQVPAQTANPAEYTGVIIANSSLVPLMNDGLVRPLDDLIAKYGGDIQESQKIRINGKVMAVAFMANTQHMYYRADVLKAAGVGVPSTYEEVLEAAEAIKSAGLMDHPLTGSLLAGWQIAEEFVNMYLGHGGEFFVPGSAAPSINNAQGIASLEMMKALSAYMNPDFLTYDTNAIQADWEVGNAAIGNIWGSRAGALLDDEGSTAEIVANTMLAAAPTVGGGSIPATTLWWDGFTIATNISDEDAEATFRAMVVGVSTEMALANADQAAWLIAGVDPQPTSVGISLTASAGAKPYPMLPYMGILHTALGNELVDFMQGNESAADALAGTEAAYISAAKEAGFL